MNASEVLLEYHERSKHRVNRYAPGPGRLDWANQPNPFREFAGTPKIGLPHVAETLATRYDDVRRGRLPAPRAFGLESVAILFELSLGLSAWKSFGGNRWALRCNPSSGNLHPTEGYLLCPPLDGLSAGVYHYVSRDHVLEQRAAVSDAQWAEAFDGGILVGLSSIHWREAWKYGMRAWRYCQHDCGHAIAAVSYAAAALGWKTRMVMSASDDEVAALLGLDRDDDFAEAEREAADVLLWVGDSPSARPLPSPRPSPKGEGEEGKGVAWFGRANRLSGEHVEWPDIEEIHRATYRHSHEGTLPWT